MDITVQELKHKLDAGENFLFLDVREPWEYEEFNLGARLLPLGNLPGELGALEDFKDAEIVVHCRSGSRSGMAKMMMTAQGFSHVRNLEGGVMAWRANFG